MLEFQLWRLFLTVRIFLKWFYRKILCSGSNSKPWWMGKCFPGQFDRGFSLLSGGCQKYDRTWNKRAYRWSLLHCWEKEWLITDIAIILHLTKSPFSTFRCSTPRDVWGEQICPESLDTSRSMWVGWIWDSRQRLCSWPNRYSDVWVNLSSLFFLNWTWYSGYGWQEGARDPRNETGWIQGSGKV